MSMEQAIRKWDGDVYRGHEPEAWADLRSQAIAVDAELTALRQQVADLRAALERVCGELYALDESEDWSVESEEALRDASAVLAATQPQSGEAQ